MGKENENIFLHIIDENYKRNKTQQKINETYLRETQQPADPRQIPSSIILELKRMSTKLQSPQTPENPQQIDPKQTAETSKKNINSEFLPLLQRIKTEKQELIKQKQTLMEIKQELQSRLAKEIQTRNITINTLKSEISNLKDECKELTQLIGIPTNI